MPRRKSATRAKVYPAETKAGAGDSGNRNRQNGAPALPVFESEGEAAEYYSRLDRCWEKASPALRVDYAQVRIVTLSDRPERVKLDRLRLLAARRGVKPPQELHTLEAHRLCNQVIVEFMALDEVKPAKGSGVRGR